MTLKQYLKLLFHAPAVFFLSFLGIYDKPKVNYAIILAACVIIVIFGVALNYILTP